MRKMQQIAFTMFVALATALTWSSAASALTIRDVTPEVDDDSSVRVLRFIRDTRPALRDLRGGERLWRHWVRELSFEKSDDGDWQVVDSRGFTPRRARRAAILGRIFLDANSIESRDGGAVAAPEPGALLVFASGLVAAGAVLRRRGTTR